MSMTYDHHLLSWAADADWGQEEHVILLVGSSDLSTVLITNFLEERLIMTIEAADVSRGCDVVLQESVDEGLGTVGLQALSA
jgi:hypothetical protein